MRRRPTLKTLLSQIKLTPAVLILILVNLLPIFGIIWLGWDSGIILFLYWVETVIVGILNVPKMLFAQGVMNETEMPSGAMMGAKLFVTGFFAFHYGFFCYGHWSFLGGMLGIKLEPSLFAPGSFFFWAAISIFASHTFSMLINYFGKGEYKTRVLGAQMFIPYTRIVIMQVVIIFGGAFIMFLDNPAPGVVILVLFKILIDVTAHSAEHMLEGGFKAPQE